MNKLKYIKDSYIRSDGEVQIILNTNFFLIKEVDDIVKEINISRCMLKFNSQLSEEIKNNILFLINDDKIIDAVKYLSVHSDLGLKDAFKVINHISERVIQKHMPPRYDDCFYKER
jgi:hypothetical protein